MLKTDAETVLFETDPEFADVQDIMIGWTFGYPRRTVKIAK